MIVVDELTPLERFYFENASKDDLIAEVLQLRSELKSSNGAIAEIARVKREAESLKSENDSLRNEIDIIRGKVINLNKLVSKLRRRLGEKAPYRGADKSLVMKLKESGLSISESAKLLCVSKSTVAKIRGMFNAIENRQEDLCKTD